MCFEVCARTPNTINTAHSQILATRRLAEPNAASLH